MRHLARASRSAAAATRRPVAFTPVPHFFPQIWSLVVLVSALGLYVAQDLGYLELLFRLDRSRISWVIATLVLAGSCHVAWHLLLYSTRLDAGERLLQEGASITTGTKSSRTHAPDNAFLQAWLLDTQSPMAPRRSERQPDQDLTPTLTPVPAREEIPDIYADRLRAPVEIGWFMVDLAIRLGLLGTIIGFILIFTSLSSVSIEGSEGLRDLLVAMSAGMGTALFTTLAGLVGATLLSVQYLILGRAAEHLLAVLVRLREAAAPRQALPG